MLHDTLRRPLTSLRLSLTDRCNLRCRYCMPEEEYVWLPRASILSFEEIQRLVGIFAGLGVNKVRLTGGEPLLRHDVPALVALLARETRLADLALTTNGMLLAGAAADLRAAGLHRVTVSLDTLKADRFEAYTRSTRHGDVLAGIAAARAAGFQRLKINTVVVRGYNEEDVVDLARLTIDHPWQVRFIEMMPFAGVTEFQQGEMVTAAETQRRIEQALGSLLPANGGELDGEAQVFHIPGAQGDIGFISSITAPFCASCTRARLTSDGLLRTCLLREHEMNLLAPLRAGATLEELRQMVLDAIWNKPWGHGLAEGEIPLNRVMSEIGG